MIYAECRQKIERMAELKEGWDSYAAPPIRAIARDNADWFAFVATENQLCPNRVAPAVVGAVAMSFRGENGRKFYIEFDNKGKACCMFANDNSEECTTEKVQLDRTAFESLIERAKLYLEVTDANV